MGIDWFTFIAQAINFLILVGLLWHFAYKPIVRAMDERESSIRDRLDDAEQKREEAEQKARELDEQREKLDQQRDELLNKAREEAEQRRKELVAEARQRVEQNEAEWRDGLRRQQNALADELRQQTGRQVVSATRRFLRELADADLEGRVVEMFEQRLRDLDEDTTQALQRAAQEADGDVRLVTAFELDDERQTQLGTQLSTVLRADAEPRFETDDTLLCGVELRAGDQRVAWNVDDYLAELQSRIETALASAAQRGAEDGDRAQQKGTDGRSEKEDE